jgi:hypothetical protein
VPRHVVAPAPAVRPNGNAAKPITLGDDTQVVVRASDPSSRDEAPISSADPTLLQGSPWVEPPDDGPATLKTGLSLAERPTGPPAYRSPGVRAGFLSGLGVVVVGGSLLLLARVAGTAWDTSGAASRSAAESTSTALVAEPSPVSAGDLSVPSPPATGTAAITVPPATGAALAGSASPAESNADASPPLRDERAGP